MTLEMTPGGENANQRSGQAGHQLLVHAICVTAVLALTWNTVSRL